MTLILTASSHEEGDPPQHTSTTPQVPAQRGTAPGALLTADDLAARWSCHKAHIYALAREGDLPAVRVGRWVRFRADAVDAFERRGGCGA